MQKRCEALMASFVNELGAKEVEEDHQIIEGQIAWRTGPLRSSTRTTILYLVVRQVPGLGAGAWVFCSGINMPRFDPICWGKGGICSNPAFKGLQQLRADVSSFALKLGRQTKNTEKFPCDLITPPLAGDGWYREAPLLIETASPADIKKILEFASVTWSRPS